jgi:hypothetical protein
MRQATRWSVGLAVSCAAMAGAGMGAGRAATQEQIGSWVLNCPGSTPHSEPCLMRFNQRLFEQAGITGDLEVQAQGKSLVPVISLRGLSSEMLTAAVSMGGTTGASIQFAGDARESLNCAPRTAGYFCSPNDTTAQRLATGLQTARSLRVRVSASMPGMNPLPAQERTLDLSGTKEALARLRIVGPSQVPSSMTALESPSPGAMMGMVDKALKAAGYRNGMADLQAMLAKYMKK